MPMTKAIESVGYPNGCCQNDGNDNIGSRHQNLNSSCIPWIMGGAIIISMETLVIPFGGVTTFNYDTLTTSIYTAWSGIIFPLSRDKNQLSLSWPPCFFTLSTKSIIKNNIPF